MSDRNFSTFLFARPTAVEGAGRLIDVGGTLTEFNRSLTEQQADRIALRMDWRAVGDDLATVFIRALGVKREMRERKQ